MFYLLQIYGPIFSILRHLLKWMSGKIMYTYHTDRSQMWNNRFCILAWQDANEKMGFSHKTPWNFLKWI